MMGESPTLPGSFQARPLVVVQPDISPFSFRAEQWMVPVGGNNTLLMASECRCGGMPRSAATFSMCLIFWRHFSDFGVAGRMRFFQLGSESPGPHQSE